MSRRTARLAVATFLASPVVPGLSRVFTGPPRHMAASGYFSAQGAGTKSGAVVFPFIETSRRHRISLGGHKFAHYDIALRLEFASDEGQAEAATDTHDDIVDALIARIESDKTMGGFFWQAGEGDTRDGDDIHVVSGIPKTVGSRGGGRLVIWTTIRFHAIEDVQV